jgi:DNA-binding MarR family transcriptional regulator
LVKAKINIPKELDFKTWWVLHQARDVIFLIRSRELGQYGITPVEAGTLLIIKNIIKSKKNPTPGEIAKWTTKEPQAVSKNLSRMEKEGLITKTSGIGKKKNQVHISLTEKGEEIYNQALKRSSIQEIMSCFTKEECLQLYTLLIKLREEGMQNLTKRTGGIFPSA